jgi:hypothetical protein
MLRLPDGPMQGRVSAPSLEAYTLGKETSYPVAGGRSSSAAGWQTSGGCSLTLPTLLWLTRRYVQMHSMLNIIPTILLQGHEFNRSIYKVFGLFLTSRPLTLTDGLAGFLWPSHRGYVASILLQHHQHPYVQDGDSRDRLCLEIYSSVSRFVEESHLIW